MSTRGTANAGILFARPSLSIKVNAVDATDAGTPFAAQSSSTNVTDTEVNGDAASTEVLLARPSLSIEVNAVDCLLRQNGTKKEKTGGGVSDKRSL